MTSAIAVLNHTLYTLSFVPIEAIMSRLQCYYRVLSVYFCDIISVQ